MPSAPAHETEKKTTARTVVEAPHAGDETAKARGESDSGTHGVEEPSARVSEGERDDARLLTREDVWYLSGFVLLAFALRFLLTWGIEHVITPDGVGYVSLGRELMAGNFGAGMSPYWPPLYPVLVGVSSVFFNDIEFAGRFVSVLAGALTPVPVYILARVSYGVRVARLAAFLSALHPLLIYYSTLVLTEATYTLLFTCGVLTGWLALRGGRTRTFLLAGLWFGACYLMKPEAAGFVVLLAALAFAAKLFGKRMSLRKLVAGVVALCVGFALLALPYVFYVQRVTGAWTLSTKMGGHMWQGTRRASQMGPQVSPLVPDAATALVQLAKALRHEYEIFNLILPPVFVLFVGLALFRRSWTKEQASRELYLALFMLATLVGYAVTLPNIRFLVPLLPLLICWVAKGVVEFEGWVLGTLGGTRGKILSTGRRLAVPLVVVVLAASLVPLFVYLLRGDKWSDYHGQKLAAQWIRAQGETRARRIMSTVPVTAFYAGAEHVTLEDEEYAAFVERARRERVDYVIINERNLKHMRLRTLLDEESGHEGLRLVHRLVEAPGHRVLVYTLADSAEGTGN